MLPGAGQGAKGYFIRSFPSHRSCCQLPDRPATTTTFWLHFCFQYKLNPCKCNTLIL